jgi:Ca2+-binding RTX toxin-like protein
MASVTLKGELIGNHINTGIYRIDLSQITTLGPIQSITIRDDNNPTGGTGSASGFDLDFIKLSNSGTINPVAAYLPSLGTISAFDFSPAGTIFKPGFFQTYSPTDPALWNGATLFGTTIGPNGAEYNPGQATLGVGDGTRLSDNGSLSLGESGQITFLLNQGVVPTGRYLYYGDSGAGNDDVQVIFSDGRDVPVHTPTIEGGGGSDVIVVGVGPNTNLGGSNSVISGGAGNDRIIGSFGNERISGDAGNDLIRGGAGDDWIWGGNGKDKLYGGAGKDVIFGGKGNDTLWGERGKDAFAFDTKPNGSNVDTIKDFKVRDDSIWLDNAVFKKIGPAGTELAPKLLKGGAFWTGDKAHDASDRVIYDKTTGALYYDQDGTGGAAQVKFAQLKPNLALTNKDFFVI